MRDPRRIGLIVAVALAVLATACSGGTDGFDADTARPYEARGTDLRPEIIGIENWLNTAEPLTIADLNQQGRVVLIDFWTYTCVNCIRTLPFLTDWDEKYRDHGLTIIGVHSPEFEFEKDRQNVADAIKRHAIGYPVAQDNEMETWGAFRNRYWPAKYLIATSGDIVYQHFGEGDYAGAEEAIRAALTLAGADVSGIVAGTVENRPVEPAPAVTRELFGGYKWNYSPWGVYAAQEEYYEGPDREVFYQDPGRRGHNQFYLQGLWRNEREAIVHARETEQLEDYIALRFLARSVNVVISPVQPGPFAVYVEIDGGPLQPEEAGADIVFDEQGRSLINVTDPRMYALVELPEFGNRELKLRSNSSSFAVYAFTFGIYLSGA